MATEQVNKIIFQIEFTDKGVVRRIGDTTVSVKKFESELKKATVANKQFNQTLSGREGMIGNSGLASATLTELGRTVSDLPYGIRGIANNLSQLSTLFITLQGKVDSNVKGFARFGRTVKVLMNELKGPLGIILAFQALIAIMDAASQGKINLGKKTSDLTKKIKEETEAVKDQVKERQAQVEILQGTILFLDLLQEGRISMTDVIKTQLDEEDRLLIVREKLIEAGIKEAEILTDTNIPIEERLNIENKLINSIQVEIGVLQAKQKLTRALSKDDVEGAKQATRDLLFQLKQIETTEKEIEEINNLIKAKDGEIDVMDNSIAAIQAEIKHLQKLQSNTALTSNEFKKFQTQIEELEKTLERITEGATTLEIPARRALQITVADVTTFLEGEQKKIDAINLRSETNRKVAELDKKESEEALALDLENLNKQNQARMNLASVIESQVSRLAQIQEQSFNAQISRLDNEREIILNNDNLTFQEKDRLLKENDKQTRDIRVKQIKFERDMFQIEAAMDLARMGMSIAHSIANIKLTATESLVAGQTAIGKFIQVLGPFGIAAYAATIGGVIASISSARNKAQEQIRAISGPLKGVESSGGGGGAAIQAPAFNVVGATQTSQLAQTIAGAEDKPLRAYVVASDVTTAQELERSTIEGASIG